MCSFDVFVRFAFDLLCDGLWLAFVLSFCGWVFLIHMFVCFVCDLLREFAWCVCLCVFVCLCVRVD